MLKLDHKVVIGYTTINVIGVTTVFVKYPRKRTGFTASPSNSSNKQLDKHSNFLVVKR